MQAVNIFNFIIFYGVIMLLLKNVVFGSYSGFQY